MKVVTVVCSVGLLLAFAEGAVAKTDEVTLRDRQQAACYNDVQRLCGNFVPDEDKVAACMKPKKQLVSAQCRAMWDVK